jgi:hypothetical protein
MVRSVTTGHVVTDRYTGSVVKPWSAWSRNTWLDLKIAVVKTQWMERILTLGFSLLLLCYIPFLCKCFSIALSLEDETVGKEGNGVKWLKDDEQRRPMLQRKGKEDKREKYNIDEWLGRICWTVRCIVVQWQIRLNASISWQKTLIRHFLRFLFAVWEPSSKLDLFSVAAMEKNSLSYAFPCYVHLLQRHLCMQGHISPLLIYQLGHGIRTSNSIKYCYSRIDENWHCLRFRCF